MDSKLHVKKQPVRQPPQSENMITFEGLLTKINDIIEPIIDGTLTPRSKAKKEAMIKQ
jgi:hypothetical protein